MTAIKNKKVPTARKLQDLCAFFAPTPQKIKRNFNARALILLSV